MSSVSGVAHRKKFVAAVLASVFANGVPSRKTVAGAESRPAVGRAGRAGVRKPAPDASDVDDAPGHGRPRACRESFSMLDHVAGLDYNDSKVIVGGVETEADGGGLCQVTSTLYNAANFAGLDVVERTPHSAQLPYIRPGMDATVWWGGPGASDDLDMKFRNTTEGYLLLREYVAEDGYVYAEVWGQPDGTEVEMSSKPTYMGADGSAWVTHQTIKKDGGVVFDGVLHEDSYEPLVDRHGRPIPPPDVPVAPVDP